MTSSGSTLLRSHQDINFDEEWSKLKPVVLKLLNQERVTHSEWQDLFWRVHSITSWVEKGSALILEMLQKEVINYVRCCGARILVYQEHEDILLKTYIQEWQKFFTQSTYLPMPFGQLEHNLLGRSPNLQPKGQHSQLQNKNTQSIAEESIVRKMMLDNWNRLIFAAIQHRLLATALYLVSTERNGETFDSQLVVGVRQSYVCLCTDGTDRLSAYREHFEKAYIRSTEDFYRAQAAQFLEANGVEAYMRYADGKLREEQVRANKYLETSHCSNSSQMLLDKCVQFLVVAFQDQILAECPRMIKQNEIEKLKLMFRLLDRSPDGIVPMLSHLESHICNQGLADMFANAQNITSDSEKYVEQLLSMFDRFSELVTDAFYEDSRFLTSRDKAFKEVVNDTTVFRLELPTTKNKSGIGGGSTKTQPESKCPELLANYCDLLLRKSPLSKKLTNDEIESKLQRVLLVLKYVQNKDVFMRYHKAHLARRLILDASADSEKEETMVTKLREAGMPADYINKLYRMLLDIEVSRDLNKTFKTMSGSMPSTAAQTVASPTTENNNTISLNNNNNNSHKLNPSFVTESVNIKILNAGAWSRTSSDHIAVSLPRELEDLIPEVEEFYRSHHSGRKLRWHHHVSNGTIQFCTAAGNRYDLDVTTFQMAVLFCWNERVHDKISYENLKLATELPDVELRRTLWSLVAFPKLKQQLILCDCETRNPKDFTDITLFWVNYDDFAIVKSGKVQKRARLNLIGRLQLSIEQTREDENEAIVQLRILRVQEAIVKIMKMRKRLTNAQLQTELVEILKNMFLPSRKMIKEQIEWLIENKYMARDEEDINTFVFVA